MKKLSLSLLFVSLSVAFAAEECPVSKISLARGLAREVYELTGQASEKDTFIDAICLKLGRVSAILRRTQGQLPGHTSTPVPPVEFKQRAIEIEGFCGVGKDTTLPRGLLHPEYLVGDFRSYIQARVEEQSAFIAANEDPKESGCPSPQN